MSDKMRVRVHITATWDFHQTVELTADEYNEFMERRHDRRDRDLAQDVMDASEITFDDGEFLYAKVEEFEDVP